MPGFDPSTVPYSAKEADFREMAFHVYYDKCYASVEPPWLRFAKALVQSGCAPIKDKALVENWWMEQHLKRMNRKRTKPTELVA